MRRAATIERGVKCAKRRAVEPPTLPNDLLTDVMRADFTITARLGMTCKWLSRHIEPIALTMLCRDLVAHRRGRLTISRLPNGVNHGISTYTDDSDYYDVRYELEYRRGEIVRVDKIDDRPAPRHPAECSTVVLHERGLTLSYGHQDDLNSGKWRISMSIQAMQLWAFTISVHSSRHCMVEWSPITADGHIGENRNSVVLVARTSPPANADEMLAWYDSMLPQLNDEIICYDQIVKDAYPGKPWVSIPYEIEAVLPGLMNFDTWSGPIGCETSDRRYLEIDDDASIEDAVECRVWRQWVARVRRHRGTTILEATRSALVDHLRESCPYLKPDDINKIIDDVVAMRLR